MASFKHKEEIKEKIKNLEANFTDAKFFEAIEVIKGMLCQETFIVIEKWLKGLQTEFKWKIINGLLALLYHDAEFFEQAQELAIIARHYFPDTEIWDRIIDNTIWGEFEDKERGNQIDN